MHRLFRLVTTTIALSLSAQGAAAVPVTRSALTLVIKDCKPAGSSRILRGLNLTQTNCSLKPRSKETGGGRPSFLITGLRFSPASHGGSATTPPAVPLPASLWLLGAGAAALAGLRRIR